MTALLEFKQKIKGIYAQYEMYLLPLLKFVLALVYFSWINTNMGYMTAPVSYTHLTLPTKLEV